MEIKERKFYLDKQKKRKTRKLANLFFITGVTAIVLIVGTYAWFIGTGTVSVSEFSVNVSSGENLLMSLDGATWTETLEISKDTIMGTSGENKAYEGNTNKWPDEKGLIPISTAGVVDSTIGRLVLYGKSSITATSGGYHLRSTRINNFKTEGTDSINDEQNGYIAFDLFIKNGSGVDYIQEYDEDSDEAIYLTKNSSVSATLQGAESSDYGIANSVRVAFMQVGRVASTETETSTIQSINCTTAAKNTGLCSVVTPTIWEPNDTSHDSRLITYFSDVCKKKTNSEENISYGEACDPITDGTATDTYVVNGDILAADNVDIYDGLNGFTVGDEYKLKKISTFTDTMKETSGSDRPTFFKLAANSITKLRVYIYIEGQDVDNYDLISKGKGVKINFGFTKDQLDLIGSDS